MSAPRIPVPTPFQLWYLAWEQFFYRAFSYGKHAAYPPPHSDGDTPTITRRRQSHTPPFHSQTTTRFPIPQFAFGDTRRYRLHPFAGRIKYENKRSYTWHKPKWYHRGDVMSAKKILSSHSGLRAAPSHVQADTETAVAATACHCASNRPKTAGWSKTWSQRIRINGKPFQAGLSSYPVVTPRQSSGKGSGQCSPRRTGRGHQKAADARSHPFRGVRHRDRAPFAKMDGRKHFRELAPFQTGFRRNRLNPGFSKLSRNRSKTSSLVSCTETRSKAYKARSHLSIVMRWTMTQGYRSTDPAPSDITDVFGKPSPPVHHRTMPYKDLGEALAKLRDAEHIWWANRLALIFLALTGVRSKNVRLATWAEIDIPNACWTLANTRMKSPESAPGPSFQTGLAGLGVRQTPRQREPNIIFPPQRAFAPHNRLPIWPNSRQS